MDSRMRNGSRRRGPILLAIVLLAVVPIAAVQRAAAQGETTPTPQGVVWRDLTLDQALGEAKEKNQMVLADVWSDHCGSCGQMDRELWDTPEGAKFMEGMIPLKIESGSRPGQVFADRFPVTGLPAIVFIRPDGTELDRVEGYTSKQEFLRKASLLREGVDPLIDLENDLAAKPDSVPLLWEVLGKYINRRRTADADSIFQRILRLDVGNRQTYAERAILLMARSAQYVQNDLPATVSYYKMLVEKYPTASSVGGAVDGAYKTMNLMGQAQQWPDWICPILKAQPANGYLQRAAAMTALRGGLRGECLAQAARTAKDLKVGGADKAAYLDSVATVLAGPKKL